MSNSTLPPLTPPGTDPGQSGTGRGGSFGEQTPTQQSQLPPTGLQRQLKSLNDYYNQVENARFQDDQGKSWEIGFDAHSYQFGAAQKRGGDELENQDMGAATSLDAMAKDLARRYGLSIGRGRLMDEQGNLLITPDQLANASGGSTSLGEAAAKLGYISQAVANFQTQRAQKQGIAAIQSGMGQLQSRGRGSMAAISSGLYQDLADLHANQEFEAQDFSFFILQEQQQIEAEMQRRMEKRLQRQARGQVIGGAAMVVGGLATGNVGLIGQGGAMIASGAGNTGWW